MKSYVLGALFLLGTIVLGIHLQSTLEGTFYFLEQQQLFLFDSNYVCGILKDIGGTAIIISQLLVQFFRIPYMGAVLTAAICGFTAWLFWLTLRKIHLSPYLFPLSFIPMLLQCVYIVEETYHYDGLIAMFGWALVLYIYGLCAQQMEWKGRTIAGCILAVCLFFSMGSVAMLFALSVLLLDLLLMKERWYMSAFPLVLIIIIGALFVLAGKIGDYPYVFGMKNYVAYYFEPTAFHSLSWQSALIIMVLFFLSKYADFLKVYMKVLVTVVIVGLAGLFYVKAADAHQLKNLYGIRQLIHYIDTEQWDAIINYKELNLNDYMHLNALNLALSHKGQLLTDLFKYPQNGTQSLMTVYQSHIEEGWLLSQLYYHVGIMGLAYDLASATSVGITYGCPAMAKIMVKSHLIYGRYQAAEKYIHLLEKTWGYADWAKEQRRFLYNDNAVENDPELGLKRKSLSAQKDLFANGMGLTDNLVVILRANPQNKAAFDYLIASLLLAKDMASIKAFVEKYGGTEVMPTLPMILQQAIISYAEHDPAYCLTHGVSDQLWSAFQEFKRRVVSLRRSQQDLRTGLANYQQTFWYYLLLSK